MSGIHYRDRRLADATNIATAIQLSCLFKALTRSASAAQKAGQNYRPAFAKAGVAALMKGWPKFSVVSGDQYFSAPKIPTHVALLVLFVLLLTGTPTTIPQQARIPRQATRNPTKNNKMPKNVT